MSGFIEIIDKKMNTHLVNISRIEEICELKNGCKIFIVNCNPALETVYYITKESYTSIKEKLRIASIINCYTKEE